VAVVELRCLFRALPTLNPLALLFRALPTLNPLALSFRALPTVNPLLDGSAVCVGSRLGGLYGLTIVHCAVLHVAVL
jgi:hypothetical protein